MTQQQRPFKYYYEGQGFRTKRDLSHGITESFLSDYGKQLKEEMYQASLQKMMSSLGIAEREASRKIFFGFTHNDLKSPDANLSVVVETVRGDNYIYMVAFSFGAGGSIITHSKEKITEKYLKGINLEASVPVEKDPATVAPKEQEKVAVSNSSLPDMSDALKGISEDFRAKD